MNTSKTDEDATKESNTRWDILIRLANGKPLPLGTFSHLEKAKNIPR